MSDGLPLSQEGATKPVSLVVSGVVDVARSVSLCVIVVYGAWKAFSGYSVCTSESTTFGNSTPLKLKTDSRQLLAAIAYKMAKREPFCGCNMC